MHDWQPQFHAGMSWDDVNREVAKVAKLSGEWCGLPLPISGLTLSIEEKNPWRARLEGLTRAMARDEDVRRHGSRAHACSSEEVDETTSLVNEWWSRRLHCQIVIYRDRNGVGFFKEAKDRPSKRFDMLIKMFDAAYAWDLEAELAAITRLETLVAEHQMRYYILAGMVIETSKRSGLTYIFRRSRPTLVLTPHKDQHNVALLVSLCLHPIGYYERTFCGSMVPTDDVIAHLMLMRGDEHLFWRRANQHPVDRMEAGL